VDFSTHELTARHSEKGKLMKSKAPLASSKSSETVREQINARSEALIEEFKSVSHDRAEETAEAKARWFQSLPLAERMQSLVSFTDLILEVNPDVMEKRHVEPIAGRVQVLSGE
jgi:hypothetical protein